MLLSAVEGLMIVLTGLNGAERSCNDSDEEDRQLLRTATAQSTPFGERASACLPLTLCVRSPPPSSDPEATSCIGTVAESTDWQQR